MKLDSSRWSIGSVTNILTREKQRQTGETHREKGNVKKKWRLAGGGHKARKPKNIKSLRTWKSKGAFFPRASRQSMALLTLISDRRPLDLQEI